MQLIVERLAKPFLTQPSSDVVSGEAQASVELIPVLDQWLQGRDYGLGKLSLVDFAVAPWLEAAPRLGVDLTTYHANLQRLLEQMRARRYWKDTA